MLPSWTHTKITVSSHTDGSREETDMTEHEGAAPRHMPVRRDTTQMMPRCDVLLVLVSTACREKQSNIYPSTRSPGKETLLSCGGGGNDTIIFELLVITHSHEGIHWPHVTVVTLRVGCWTISVAKILTESLLG